MEIEKKKDWWDKIQTIAIVLNLIAVPAIIVYFNFISNTSSNKTDKFNIAVNILRDDPNNTEINKDIRLWAIKYVENYTGKKFGDKLETTPLSVDFAYTIATSTPGTEVAWAKHIMSSYFPVSILSQPTGAEVYVDGKFIGKTNIIKMMPSGEHAVKLKLNKKEHVVKVKPTENDIITFDFDK